MYNKREVSTTGGTEMFKPNKDVNLTLGLVEGFKEEIDDDDSDKGESRRQLCTDMLASIMHNEAKLIDSDEGVGSEEKEYALQEITNIIGGVSKTFKEGNEKIKKIVEGFVKELVEEWACLNQDGKGEKFDWEKWKKIGVRLGIEIEKVEKTIRERKELKTKTKPSKPVGKIIRV